MGLSWINSLGIGTKTWTRLPKIIKKTDNF